MELGDEGRVWGASLLQPAAVVLLPPQNMVSRQANGYLCPTSKGAKKGKEGKENGENEEKMRLPILLRLQDSVCKEEFILMYY